MKNIIANICDSIYNNIVFAQKELQRGNMENAKDWLNTAKSNAKYVKQQIEKL